MQNYINEKLWVCQVPHTLSGGEHKAILEGAEMRRGYFCDPTHSPLRSRISLKLALVLVLDFSQKNQQSFRTVE